SERCPLRRLGASDPGSGTTPGVFIHAAAIEAAVTGNLVRPLPPVDRATAAVLMGMAGALLGVLTQPWKAPCGLTALGGVAFCSSACAARLWLVVRARASARGRHPGNSRRVRRPISSRGKAATARAERIPLLSRTSNRRPARRE